MTLGIQTQIALANLDRANQRLIRANKRLAIIKIMMGQFQVQCNALPENDPMRVIVETFIKAVRDAADGIVRDIDGNAQSDVIEAPTANALILPKVMQ